MINFETFMLGLLATSVLTGLVTEGIKVLLVERGVKYQANALAGIVAVVLSVVIGTGYIILTGITFTAQVAVCMVALAIMGWLCAMLGYDKVVQAITQFTTKKEG